MEKLSFKNRILIGLTLFSMFFGAGNLIFPPHLGAQAGGNVGPAPAGLCFKRHRYSGTRRCGGGPFGRTGKSGTEGASGICIRLYGTAVSVDRALSGDSENGGDIL